MAYRYFVPAFLWTLVIIVLISLPVGSLPTVFLKGIQSLDKFSHFLLFAVLGWLLAFAFFKQKSSDFIVKNRFLLAIAIGFFIGVTTEFYQHFCTSTRLGEVLDVAANFFGTIFGAYIFGLLRPKFEKIG